MWLSCGVCTRLTKKVNFGQYCMVNIRLLAFCSEFIYLNMNFLLLKLCLQANRYQLALEEKGTPFLEEIDVDEEQDVEVFRVPAHNNVEGADFYHDFKVVSVGPLFEGSSFAHFISALNFNTFFYPRSSFTAGATQNQ